ncbi:MAG TPA: hypothetical protein VMJ12_07720 [Candidatus Acidoferrales bacterium]|nr:hypothetical protein [Candidatus Acidoferrales bacterium]
MTEFVWLAKMIAFVLFTQFVPFKTESCCRAKSPAVPGQEINALALSIWRMFKIGGGGDGSDISRRMPSPGRTASEFQLMRLKVPANMMEPLASVSLCIPFRVELLEPLVNAEPSNERNLLSLLTSVKLIAFVPSPNERVLSANSKICNVGLLTGGLKISVKLEADASPRASELVFDGVKSGGEKIVAEPLVISATTGLEKVPP